MGPSGLTHGVVVGVVLEGVLPDEVSVGHELADGDVLVLVYVGQQSGEVHRLLDHHHVVGDLQEEETMEEGGRASGMRGQTIRETMCSCADQ